MPLKLKLVGLFLVLSVSMALPAFAQHRGVSTGSGRTFGYRPYCRGGGVSWSIGIGFPFYGGYYSGYPYYGGYYPYAPYGYGYSPYGGYSYSGGYYGGNYGGGGYYGATYEGRQVYGTRSRGSTVARVQQRLAQAGYYRGEIDGVMG
ncbi:MAG: peptidoglycan-binding domain-containing protein, partial [Chthoniobacterales bacterium]